ncbi:MAG: hypothetical protein LBL79_12515 [Prevotella sp.]|jgi:hypothetical protein|nr:hypothetical protein [Prevotella sp.]
MSRIQIPINGISTTSAWQEGDCCSLVNLRPKNGALHPVAPRKELTEGLFQQYDIVFVHHVSSTAENWIGVVNVADNNGNDRFSVYWETRDGQPQNIVYSIEGKVNSVQQIGNTLSLITEDNIYYLFYRDNKYVFLDEIPQVPPIQIRPNHVDGLVSYFGSINDESIHSDNFIERIKGVLNATMYNLVNGYTDSAGSHEPKGPLLFDACFIRYAFRLYDGSLTKHSPPILVMPARSIVGVEGVGGSDSIKVISYAVTNDRLVADQSTVTVCGYNLELTYDLAFSGWENWKDIIQSVDVFMSAPLGVSSVENIRIDMPFSGYRHSTYNLIKGISKETLKKVSEASTFYFIRSILLGRIQLPSLGPKDPIDIFPSTDKDISTMENLIYQEVMSDNGFSNHKYGAGYSYAYNSRLHLANITTEFFKGFDSDYFLCPSSGDYPNGNYNGYKYKDAPGPECNQLVIEVEINTGLATEKVLLGNNSGAYANGSLYKMFLSGFLSYPDPRATRMTIYRLASFLGDDQIVRSRWDRVFSQPLKKHSFLSLSYYMRDDLNPIVASAIPVQTGEPDTNKTVSITEPNKMKVSELNNPLLFPNRNTYQISNGTILAMASNAIRISEGQFGQYPLYVFTANGIYSLNTGEGEVVYSTQSAPASYEVPTTGIVCPTPFGIVFTSSRGVCIISGQQVDLLTPQLQQPPQDLQIQTDERLEGVVLNLRANFVDFLKVIEYILYNSAENELIIHDKDAAFNYVYCFDSRQFYQSTEKIDGAVQNTFPDLLVIDGVKIKDYSESESSGSHVSLITRPLLFGTPDLKRLERMILRANLFGIQNPGDGKQSVLLNYYSMDEVNFRILRGMSLAPASRKDVDMGMFSRSKFRQFMLAFAGVVDEKSEIRFIEAEVEKEYQNTKMR